MKNISLRTERTGSGKKNKIGTGDRTESVLQLSAKHVLIDRMGYNVNQLDRIMEGRMQELLDALQEV